jgi:hypothetical protein
MHHRQEGIPAFEELFLYACPKFISANPPPYNEPSALATYIEEPQIEPAQRHLTVFLSSVRTQSPVPTLRSFLKLYTSLDAKKLANFLDADEEEMVQQMMVMKQTSRSISRVGGEKGLLEGQPVVTSDLNFVINEVCGLKLTFANPSSLLYNLFRTWCISRNQQSGDVMPDGLSRTLNVPNGTSMICAIPHFQ